MKAITIVSEDKIGLLADISYILSKNKINIETISANSLGGKAVIILTVAEPQKVIKVLGGSGYNNVTEDYLVVKLEDKPGELNKVAMLLAQNKINISNVHLLTRDGNHSLVALKVDKTRKAKALLGNLLADSE